MDMLGGSVGDFDRYIISPVSGGGAYGGAQFFSGVSTRRYTHARLMALRRLPALPCPAGQNNDAFMQKSNNLYGAERPVAPGD
jgi:hypothetical protein